MITYGFFNAINGDRRYNAQDFAKYFDKIVGNGVFANPSTSLQVKAHEGMKIKVSPGRGWIDGHYMDNDADEILSIAESDMVLDRIDQVVMRLDMREEGRCVTVAVKKGTPAQTPVAPALQRDEEVKEYALADVFVKNKSIAVAGSAITDRRMDKNVCGYVTSLIDQVDTTTLYQQIQEDLKEFRDINQQQFEDWVAQLRDILDDEAAGKLTNLITGHIDDEENPHRVTKAQLGLSHVDNTSDANKPVSSATKTALDGKLSLTGGTVSGPTNFTGALTQTGRNILNMEGIGGTVFAGNSQAAGTTNFTGTLQNAGNTVLTANSAGRVYQGTNAAPNVNVYGNLQKSGVNVQTQSFVRESIMPYISDAYKPWNGDLQKVAVNKFGNLVTMHIQLGVINNLPVGQVHPLTSIPLPAKYRPYGETNGVISVINNGGQPVTFARLQIMPDGVMHIAPSATITAGYFIFCTIVYVTENFDL